MFRARVVNLRWIPRCAGTGYKGRIRDGGHRRLSGFGYGDRRGDGALDAEQLTQRYVLDAQNRARS